ncbi:uncharacterized protein LOC131666736 [Phymastichus coffea]|uniref:uncharacterized protein LOC131666736 n=1 Tax=Phymastichus coffea TaxID=108790 RepID=UPI00273BF496|nr:uncharacterized protein LOC131666736 [Phymastichus coffea]
MFGYALFVILWLVADPGLANEWLTAPEMFGDTVARLFYTEIRHESQYIFHVKVETIYYDSRTPVKQCLFQLVSRPVVAAMNITTFRRLDEDKIVLSWYDEMTNGSFRQTKIVVLNMSNCILVELNVAAENAIVIPSTDELNIFLNDSKYPCLFTNMNNNIHSIHRCWYSYSLQDTNFTNPKVRFIKEFNVALDWSSIRIEQLSSKDFVIRGFQGNLYKVLGMNYASGELDTLLSIPSMNRTLQMASTGLTLCWSLNSGYNNVIYCDQFNNQYELVYSTEESFNEPMIIKYVQSDYEGQISCLLAKAKCTDIKDCWTFTRKNFYRKDNYSTENTVEIKCESRNRNKWIFFGFANNTSYATDRAMCSRSGDTLGTDS